MQPTILVGDGWSEDCPMAAPSKQRRSAEHRLMWEGYHHQALVATTGVPAARRSTARSDLMLGITHLNVAV